MSDSPGDFPPFVPGPGNPAVPGSFTDVNVNFAFSTKFDKSALGTQVPTLAGGLLAPSVIPPLQHTQITDFGSAASAAAPVQSVAGLTGTVTASQLAIIIPASTTGNSRGGYNAATNTPALSANGGGGNVNDVFDVIVAGTMTIDNVGALPYGSQIKNVLLSDGVTKQWQLVPQAANFANLTATGASTLNTVSAFGNVTAPRFQAKGRTAFPIPPIMQTADDKSLIGALPDGAIQVGGLRLISNAPYRSAMPFPWALEDAAHKAPLRAAKDGSGNIDLNFGTGFLPAIAQPYRSFKPALQNRFESAAGLASGYDSDGAFTFYPSLTSVKNSAQKGYQYASSLSTAYELFNVRYGVLPRTKIASVSAPDGKTYDVIQNQNGLGTLMIAAKSAGQILPVFYQYGQSNAGAGGSLGTSGPWSVGSPFPFHIVTDNNGGQAYGSGVYVGGTKYDFASYVDPSKQAAPFYSLTSTTFAYEQFLRDEGKVSPGRYARSVWYGGEPIDVFVKGAVAYQVLLQDAMGVARVAPSYDRTPACYLITWVQGENVSPTLPYASTLQTLITNLNADLATIFPNSNSGVTPLWLIAQVSDADNGTTSTSNSVNGDAFAALTVAQAGGQYVTMSGPLYMAPLEVNSVHAIEIGRVMAGEIQAAAWDYWWTQKQATGTGSWNPLWPTSFVVQGTNQLVITYALPPDGGNIEFDTDWIGSPTPAIPGAPLGALANYGFAYSDSASNTISSVAITSSNQVTITFSGNISTASSRVLTYAAGTNTPCVGTTCGWSVTRGQLRSPTTRLSAGHRAGYAVPQYIKHYSVRFSQSF